MESYFELNKTAAMREDLKKEDIYLGETAFTLDVSKPSFFDSEYSINAIAEATLEPGFYCFPYNSNVLFYISRLVETFCYCGFVIIGLNINKHIEGSAILINCSGYL